MVLDNIGNPKVPLFLVIKIILIQLEGRMLIPIVVLDLQFDITFSLMHLLRIPMKWVLNMSTKRMF